MQTHTLHATTKCGRTVKPPRRLAVRAHATSGLAHLPAGARQKFEELIREDSDVMLLDNIVDGFYVSPKFLDKMAIHCAKNYLANSLNKIKIPLILGIWGGKGQGKTFQVQLAFKAMKLDPIIMSAGELEAGNAGEPAKLVRQRYREGADVIKKGKMSALFINDLDAGAGRMGESTQYTVNNQMVNATLMNIADNPTNVQLPGVYKEESLARVPIVCTGNDFSTLYAPLIRDGRMEKFYWNPTRKDRIGVCKGIFKEDNLSDRDVETLVDNFPGQSIDFFGALRARIYDDAVKDYAMDMGYENIGKNLVNARGGLVTLPKPPMSMDNLMSYGVALVQEQDNVKRVQLAEQYLSGAALAGSEGSSIPENYLGGKGEVKAVKSKPLWKPKKSSAPEPAPSRSSYDEDVPRQSYTPPADNTPSYSYDRPSEEPRRSWDEPRQSYDEPRRSWDEPRSYEPAPSYEAPPSNDPPRFRYVPSGGSSYGAQNDAPASNGAPPPEKKMYDW